MKFALPVLVAAVMAVPIHADCIGEERREATVSAAGIQSVRIIGRAGTLRVQGRSGLAQVRATGTACASSRQLASAIRIDAKRNGTELLIEAVIPEDGSGGSIWPFGIGRYAKLDLVVELPGNLPVRVTDGSGEAWVRDVAAAQVSDGSGALEITNIRGNLSVSDGSGSLTVRNVTGNVTIKDGSGSIEVSDVGGSVTLTDGSGSMTIRNVRGSVIVENDGSGSIEVSNVARDFIVENDGSGRIDHQGVRGQVRIPRD